MNATRMTLAVLLAGTLFVAGCTSTQSGTGAGAGIGAVIGALAGQAIGRNTTGTLIGAGAGALAGAMVGNTVGQAKEQEETDARLRRIESRQASARPQGSPVTGTGRHQSDPTSGQLTNATSWVIQVFIDREPSSASAPTVTMNPGETRPLNLDIGQHRVVATALVQTQFGQRKVGRYDQIINVDPRQNGFQVQFTTRSFQ